MKKEVLLNFIFTILVTILGFIQNRYFIQYMGIDTLGMMKLFSQFLAYLNIVEMGLGSASAFALYKPLAEKNYRNISIIMCTMESIYNRIAILIFILGILCIPIIPFFLEGIKIFSNIYFYWILYVLNTISNYLFIKYIILFIANQEFLYTKAVQAISQIIFQLIQIYCIIRYKSFYIFIILLIISNLTQWLFFKIHYKNKYSYIFKTKERFNGIKNNIKNLFWHKIGMLVVFNTDLVLISKFTSLEIVGIYASYQMVIQMLKTIIDIITNVLSPKIGKFIAEHNKNEVYISFKKINILYCFISTFFTYCTYILINDFIFLWIGNTIILSKFSLKLICFNLWINLFRGILESFKAGAGFFDDIKSPILESIINLFVSIILGIKYGLNGIIIGTIISNIIVVLIYKPILVFKKCFDKSFKEYIKVYSSYFILVIVSLMILNFMKKLFLQKNIYFWTDWIVYAIKISSISGIIMILIFLLNKDFRNLIRNLKIK